ncbi:unnamed protein product [Gongylonema pulchrum]|uniref:Uncharacterized protein n=1 Tax=Gongylonema pulchrum TaxID=637853 RepID=A0A183E7N1_9BILA|nr:unnamed protein product [Gongylonema pulchrum]
MSPRIFFSSNLHPKLTYRTAGSTWHTTTSCDRPGSSYLPDYKTRYDDNYAYRRSAHESNMSG